MCAHQSSPLKPVWSFSMTSFVPHNMLPSQNSMEMVQFQFCRWSYKKPHKYLNMTKTKCCIIINSVNLFSFCPCCSIAKYFYRKIMEFFFHKILQCEKPKHIKHFTCFLHYVKLKIMQIKHVEYMYSN